MRASAFEAWAKHPATKHWAVQTSRSQLLESTHGVYRFGVELYNVIQRHAPWLHHVYFSYLEAAAMHESREQIFPLARARFSELLETHRPEVILSTHAHLNHGFFEHARFVLGRKRVRCATTCGELFGGYGFSRHWVNPQADLFLGAVSETCDEATRLGMPAKRNVVGGFLLKPDFYTPALSPEQRLHTIKYELGLDPERFILMLATGANGANNHIACLNALKHSGLPVQVVALCGKDTQALNKVQHWASNNPRLPVCALPLRSDMHRLMDCVGAIFARPGTGTTSESILRTCPIIFNGLGGVMPQEWITLKYARKYGFHSLVIRPSELPQAVHNCMREAPLLRERLQQRRPPKTPEHIFSTLANLL